MTCILPQWGIGGGSRQMKENHHLGLHAHVRKNEEIEKECIYQLCKNN